MRAFPVPPGQAWVSRPSQKVLSVSKQRSPGPWNRIGVRSAILVAPQNVVRFLRFVQILVPQDPPVAAFGRPRASPQVQNGYKTLVSKLLHSGVGREPAHEMIFSRVSRGPADALCPLSVSQCVPAPPNVTVNSAGVVISAARFWPLGARSVSKSNDSKGSEKFEPRCFIQNALKQPR
eukprot:gene14497-biopygen12638